jgi:predicted RNase H-like HicB family nuclease
MATKVLTYKVRLKKEPEGGFTVTVPALPGCVTYGENEDQALTMAKEAIEGYIAVLKENGDSIPDDTESQEYSISIPQ